MTTAPVGEQIKDSLGISSFLLTFMTYTPGRLVAITDFTVKVNAGIKKKYRIAHGYKLTDEETSRKKELLNETKSAKLIIRRARYLLVQGESNWPTVEAMVADVYDSMYSIAELEDIISINSNMVVDVAQSLMKQPLNTSRD